MTPRETGPYSDLIRAIDRMADLYGPDRVAEWLEGWIASRAPHRYRASGAFAHDPPPQRESETV